MVGLEPTTSASQTQRARRLRHTPVQNNIVQSSGLGKFVTALRQWMLISKNGLFSMRLGSLSEVR